MNKILVVEDDKDINNLLKIILESNGYEVFQAYSGKMGIEMLNDDFDLVLLDLMMPLVSGEEMVVKMRAKNFNMPVIIITAKIDEKTKFYTFDIGADDFITKPFEKADLLNRVKANIRRYRHLNSNMSKNSILEFKNLKLYEDENRILIKGEELKVTPIEFEILKTLLKNPNKIFSKENLYRSVWNDEYFFEDDTINVHISNLRSKIKKLDTEEYIETVWAVGYRLKK